MKSLLVSLLGTSILATTASADTSVVERLIASYDTVASVQVEIRRDTTGGGASARRLSRVYFRRPDQIHVESVTPPRRRIVADGTNFYSYIDGDPKGYSRPVPALEGDWLISLRQVPGTAMEHLLRFRGLPEQTLSPTEAFPTRIGITTETRYATLSLDSMGRLVRVEFYTDPSQTSLFARYDYETLVEPIPGAWFALLQKAEIHQGKDVVTETTRLSNLAVNQPIPDPLFDHTTFFKGVTFTDNLEDIYGR